MGRIKIKANGKNTRKIEDTLKSPHEAMNWLQSQRQWLMGVGIAVLVVLVATWAFTSYGQVRERRAQMQYAQILDKLNDQKDPVVQAWTPQVVAELKSLCENFKSTRAGLSAQLDLAQAYYQMGQYEQSVLWDQKNLQNLKSDAVTQALVRLRLVQSYRALNRLDEALAQCDALQTMSVPGLSREIQWQTGQLYALKQHAAKAAEHFQKALEAPGSYPAEGIIQEGLARVRLSGLPAAPSASP